MNHPLPQTSQDIEHRHAQALAEISQMHASYKSMTAQLAEAQRALDRQKDVNEMLKEERNRLFQENRVLTRKLIRLAAAMSNMSRLAADADEIMRSVKDWEEAETDRSLEDIFEKVSTAKEEAANG